VNLDGTDDYIAIGTKPAFDISPGSAHTATLWFKAPVQTSNRELIWKQGGCIGWDIMLRSDGRIQFNFNAGNNSCTGYSIYQVLSSAGTRYDDNNWHFVAGVVDRPNFNMALYVDANQVGSAAPDNGNSGTGGELRIGTSWNDQAPLKGTIDEVKIFNRVLSSAEVASYYNFNSLPINPGNTGTLQVSNSLSRGTHTIRVCNQESCRTGYLSIT